MSESALVSRAPQDGQGIGDGFVAGDTGMRGGNQDNERVPGRDHDFEYAGLERVKFLDRDAQVDKVLLRFALGGIDQAGDRPGEYLAAVNEFVA